MNPNGFQCATLKIRKITCKEKNDLLKITFHIVKILLLCTENVFIKKSCINVKCFAPSTLLLLSHTSILSKLHLTKYFSAS